MEYYKFFNLKKLVDLLGVQHDYIYNNFKGSYTSLTPGDKTKIANILKPNVEKMFEKLGYEITITRKTKREEAPTT